MRFTTGFVGPDPVTALNVDLAIAAQAVRAGVAASTEGLKNDLRSQIRAAGLGIPLGNAVGSKVYPNGPSISAAGMVFPRGRKAEEIFTSFNDAPVIQTKSGRKLAIPTKNAFLGGRGGKRPTPAEFESRTGIKLSVAPSKRPGVSLLVGSRLAQKVRGARREMLIYFVLLPLAQNRRRLSFDSVAQAWADRTPALIESAFPQGLK
jgi:hypothetical protein